MLLSNMEHLVKVVATCAKWQQLEVEPPYGLEFDQIFIAVNFVVNSEK